MATGGKDKCRLVRAGTVTLKNTNKYPMYNSIVVCQDKIVVLDEHTYKVSIHGLHDGKLLASSGSLESRARDMCLMDAMTICVIHDYGLIKMMSIDSTDMSRDIKTTKTLRLQGVLLDWYDGVVRFKDSLVVTGVKQGMMYWCIVSLQDGHVDTIHQICEGDGWCRVTTKDNIIYISCWAGHESFDNTGVYGFDILNPSQCKYKHQLLQSPSSIVINEDGNIFVCNHGLRGSCIHQLTASCQLVAIFTWIFTPGIPSDLYALFWDNGRLYGTCKWSNDITVFCPVYQGSHKASEVPVSNERKHPVTEETAIQIGKGNVRRGQSSVETEMPPSMPFPGDSEDKQGPIIPVEILHMDHESLMLYKKALQDGMEKVYNIRVMVVGQFGVGKTTLTKRLLGHQVDLSERRSTEGIDVYKHCCKISLDTGEWITQHEDFDKLLRLQRLMQLLSGPDQMSDVRQEQEGQREAIYQREATSEDDITHSNDTATSPIPDQEINLEYSQPAQLSIIKEDGGHGVEHSDHETSTVTVPLSKAKSSDKEKKKDAVMEIIHLINENADKLEKDTVKYAALSVWDFAGQYAFYTTHQTFLSSRALYLLVIDLNQQITDLIEDECFLDTEGIKECIVRDLVEIWMNSIHTCAPTPQANIPHVILVGTHVDKLSEKSRKDVIDKYFKELRYILKDKPTIRHLMDDIAIDNTHSDPMLETLKKRIFELASEQSHWGEEKPARWIPLEQAIMTLKESGAKVVARSLIEDMNRSGSVKIEDRDELDLFLRFHHEMGTILYFSIEALREKIVLDPQWLINALKSLITAETFIKKNSVITSKWYEFKETGKLTNELIDAIWTKKENPDFHDNKEHILLLMGKLNIIAKPRSYGEDETIKEENYFLVPCMLRQATPKEIISPESHPEKQSTSTLCFISTDKFLPPPVFHRLIGACLTHWPIAKQKSDNLIYCGCCVFDLDLHHRLTLYFRNYVIFAQVTGSGVTDTKRSSERCREARKFIFKNLSELIGNVGNSLQLHVQCPDSEADSLESLIAVSHLKMHEKVPCHSHEKSHILVSGPLLKFWFKEKGNQAEEVEETEKLHQKVLNRCLPELVQKLDISTVSDYIIQKECFDNVIMQDIKDQKTTSDQIRELIKRIQQRGYDTYEKFKDCLVLAKQENLKAILDNVEAELASRVKGKDEAQATVSRNVSSQRQPVVSAKGSSTPATRPSTSDTREPTPATKPSTPATRESTPATRPSDTRPSTSATRPSTPASRESMPATRPSKSATRESQPATRESEAATRPLISTRVSTPATKVSTLAKRESQPATRPSTSSTRESTPATRESQPATRPSTPATRESAAAKRPSTPATRESQPATRPSTPVTRPSASSTIVSTPATRESQPATRPSAPATRPSTSSTRESTPATRESQLATRPSTSATRPSTHATRESTPATRVSTPVTKESQPATISSTSATRESAAATRPSTSATRASTSATRESTPATRVSTPATRESTPSTRASTPAKTDSTPATRESTPSTRASMPAKSDSTPTASAAAKDRGSITCILM